MTSGEGENVNRFNYLHHYCFCGAAAIRINY